MFTDIDLTSILYLDTVTYLSKKNETGIYETDIVTHVAKERRRLLWKTSEWIQCKRKVSWHTSRFHKQSLSRVSMKQLGGPFAPALLARVHTFFKNSSEAISKSERSKTGDKKQFTHWDIQILGASPQNSVPRVTWNPRFFHPCYTTQ